VCALQQTAAAVIAERMTSIEVATEGPFLIHFNNLLDREGKGYPVFGEEEVDEDGNSTSLLTALSDITLETSLLIYVSHHPYLREQQHPDNERHDQYSLLVQAVDAIWMGLAIDASDCYVYIDYSCRRQAKQKEEEEEDKVEGKRKGVGVDVEKQAEQIRQVIKACDVLLTPLVDEQHESWQRDASKELRRGGYQGEAWRAYLSNAWSSTEMLLAACETTTSSSMKDFMTGTLRFVAEHQEGRKAHFLFGTKEYANTNPRPLLLEPLLLTPTNAKLLLDAALSKRSETEEADDLLACLTTSLLPLVVANEMTCGYTGERNEQGQMHGNGTLICEEGSRYDGAFVNDEKHGFGRHVAINGDIYSGHFEHDLRQGDGELLMTGGERYVGAYHQGKKHGHGFLHLADGSTYQGTFVDNQFEGHGTFVFSNSDVYVGEYRRGVFHGNGKYTKAAGKCMWDGEWADGQPVQQEGSSSNNKRHGEEEEEEHYEGEEEELLSVLSISKNDLLQEMKNQGR